MEAPTHSLGQTAVGWGGDGCSSRVLRTTRVGCIGTERVPPEEEEGEDSDGQEGGPGSP